MLRKEQGMKLLLLIYCQGFRFEWLSLSLRLNTKEKWKLFWARLVHMFKNWKLLFENICGNTCGWKSVLKCVKCCLKTEDGCLKTQTKHPLYYLAYFCYYLWAFLYFLILFMGLTVLFQLTFTFIYSTFNNKFLVSVK